MDLSSSNRINTDIFENSFNDAVIVIDICKIFFHPNVNTRAIQHKALVCTQWKLITARKLALNKGTKGK